MNALATSNRPDESFRPLRVALPPRWTAPADELDVDFHAHRLDEPFASRDLRALRPAILFVDGAGEHLVAWALTSDGRRILLALEPGAKDDAQACRAFLESLRARGLQDPLLVVSDGDATLWRECLDAFPSALVQRCLAHQVLSLTRHPGQHSRPIVLRALRAAYEAPTPALAQAMRADAIKRHAAAFPGLLASFDRSFDSCTAYLALPRSLHRVARSALTSEWMLVAERRAGPDAPLAELASAFARALAASRTVEISEEDCRLLDEMSERQRLGECAAAS